MERSMVWRTPIRQICHPSLVREYLLLHWLTFYSVSLATLTRLGYSVGIFTNVTMSRLISFTDWGPACYGIVVIKNQSH